MKWILLLDLFLNTIWYIKCLSYVSTTAPIFIPCDPVFISANSGSFSSPNFPDKYNSNEECTWRITVDEGRKIELMISDIDIEKCTNCNCDALEIYDGADNSANLLKHICYKGGKSTTVKSSSNVLFAVFSTDGSVTRTGFKAQYNATCLQRFLMKGGNEDWFNFFDTPKASPVANALLGSGKVYKGTSGSNVTFTIEGTKQDQFLFKGAILLSRYAKQVKFTFIYNVKKPKKNNMITNHIKNSKKWTPIKIKNHKWKMDQLLITLTWDSLAGKKGKKVQVRGMKVTVCGYTMN